MVIITATELKQNLGKYLELAQTEDVLVKKNNKVIVKLVSSNSNSLDNLLAMKGILKEDKVYVDNNKNMRFLK